jgi:hypothetical protein
VDLGVCISASVKGREISTVHHYKSFILQKEKQIMTDSTEIPRQLIYFHPDDKAEFRKNEVFFQQSLAVIYG